MKTWEKRVAAIAVGTGLALLISTISSSNTNADHSAARITPAESAPALTKMLVPKKIKLITHFSPSATA
jgi:hypothetical protein